MDKKEFFEPEVKVVELDAREIICMSGDVPGGGEGEENNPEDDM